MKYLITLILFFVVSQGYSQDSTQVETPIIISKLAMGAQLEVDNIQIRFIDVINDSRCPKNVNCVRAGEAKVLVEIYQGNKFIEKKVVEITPTTYLINDLPLLHKTQNARIKAFNLLPYPEYGRVIKKEDYFFQLVVEN